MVLGIRGENPIWSEVDLQGNLFDDTFYLFVLENTIPYAPATVYHDADLNTPWTQPIRFLGNGTLPSDIFYEADTTYRLEFRQGSTQQDPLIYEVDNYDPGVGGSNPFDSITIPSSNQITNPQFALMSLGSPVTITDTNPDPIELAPGWTLIVAGTGSVTIERVALTSTNSNPSNAPYALHLTLSGWTNDSVFLRQRFEQNGMLWADKFVSNAITARIEGSPQTISANLVDSNGTGLGEVLSLTSLNEAWNEFTGFAELPDTTNPDEPPSAYIDYLLSIPSNIDIYLTSFQLVVQDFPIEPSFEQDSINRQIDHTYNRAYPIMPIGTVIAFYGFSVPEHFYFCNGAEKNRIRDYLLFNAMTTTETVTLTNGVNTFTVVSSTDYFIGMAIESTGIPASTTISNIVGTTITMSANATDTGANTVRFFAAGAGNGTTTFNLPDLPGYGLACSGGALFSGVNGVGLSGGASTHALTSGENGPHVHAVMPPGNSDGGGPFTGHIQQNAMNDNQFSTTFNTESSGSGTPFGIVQPTKLAKFCIRYQ